MDAFRTRITELLGIRYPIVQGGMQWVSRAELVAAVSEAGGLGVLSALTFETPEELRGEIRRTRSLTSKPFGVNITLLPTLRERDIKGYIEVALAEGVKIFETAGRNPEPYMGMMKGAGAVVMHKCPALRFAKKAEEVGCDAVIVNGFEGAGHPGEDDVTTFVLLPIVADALKVPVIAAGGIGDGRGLVAALALGAEGVLMGTRFLATKESPLHPRAKMALLRATERDTVLIQRSLRNSERVLKNPLSERILKMEARGATLEDLIPLIKGENSLKAVRDGEVEEGLLVCGQAVGLVREVPTVRELMEGIIAEARETIKRLSSEKYLPLKKVPSS